MLQGKFHHISKISYLHQRFLFIKNFLPCALSGIPEFFTLAFLSKGPAETQNDNELLGTGFPKVKELIKDGNRCSYLTLTIISQLVDESKILICPLGISHKMS